MKTITISVVPNKFKIKTTEIKKFDQYCDYGLGGRAGFYCVQVDKIYKNVFITEDGDRISLAKFYLQKVKNKMKYGYKVVVK